MLEEASIAKTYGVRSCEEFDTNRSDALALFGTIPGTTGRGPVTACLQALLPRPKHLSFIA